MKKEPERSRQEGQGGVPGSAAGGRGGGLRLAGKEGRLPSSLSPERRKNHRTEEICVRAHLSLSDFKPQAD